MLTPQVDHYSSTLDGVNFHRLLNLTRVSRAKSADYCNRNYHHPNQQRQLQSIGRGGGDSRRITIATKTSRKCRIGGKAFQNEQPSGSRLVKMSSPPPPPQPPLAVVKASICSINRGDAQSKQDSQKRTHRGHDNSPRRHAHKRVTSQRLMRLLPFWSVSSEREFLAILAPPSVEEQQERRQRRKERRRTHQQTQGDYNSITADACTQTATSLAIVAANHNDKKTMPLVVHRRTAASSSSTTNPNGCGVDTRSHSASSNSSSLDCLLDEYFARKCQPSLETRRLRALTFVDNWSKLTLWRLLSTMHVADPLFYRLQQQQQKRRNRRIALMARRAATAAIAAAAIATTSDAPLTTPISAVMQEEWSPPLPLADVITTPVTSNAVQPQQQQQGQQRQLALVSQWRWSPSSNVIAGSSGSGTTDSASSLCVACAKPVYLTERVDCGKFGLYHDACFRCVRCLRVLRLVNFHAFVPTAASEATGTGGAAACMNMQILCSVCKRYFMS